MIVRKVIHVESKGKGFAEHDFDHYVAIDWSLLTMAIGHMSRRDDAPRVFDRPTNLKDLKSYLKSLKGRTIITLEESGPAHWLYLELYDYVDRILICDPFHNKLLLHGPKTDTIDAGKLCELPRARLLKEVYHSDSRLYELRTLVSAYQDVVCAGVRALNQQRALELSHRDKGKTAAFVDEILNKNIDLYKQCKEQYERRFHDLVRHNKHHVSRKVFLGLAALER